MKHFYLLIAFAVATVYEAQNGWTEVNAPAITGQVFGELTVDQQGNYWFSFNNSSTTDDLAKFDGFNWTLYSSPAGAIMGSWTGDVLFDNSNNMYVCSTVGLQVFNGSSWTVFNTSNSSLPSNNITCAAFDGTNVWVGTVNGLCKYNSGSFTVWSTLNSGIPNDTIYSVYVVSPGQIFIGNRKSVIAFDGVSQFQQFIYDPAAGMYDGVTGIAGDAAQLFVSTYKGIYRLRQGQFTDIDSILPPGAEPQYHLKSVVSNGNGTEIIYPAPYYLCVLDSPRCESYVFPIVNTASSQEMKAVFNPVKQEYALLTKGSTLKLMILKPQLYNGLCRGINGRHAENYKLLDINHIRAGVSNKGDKHWDLRNGNAYEVPKGQDIHSAYMSCFMMGGLDTSGQLHLVAQSPWHGLFDDLWPGPLDTITAAIDSATAWTYDKVWKVNKYMISAFQQAFASGLVQNGTYNVPVDILTWPAHGSGNYSRKLAPFVDVDANGVYNPLTGGDYPVIKGDESIYAIFNDNLAAHTASQGLPLGIEVHYEEYAFECGVVHDSDKVINYTTFQDFLIINRSQNRYDSVYFGLDESSEFGCTGDERSTVIPSENAMLTFVTTEPDSCSYGAKLPLQSLVFLEGPTAAYQDTIDNNNNGVYNEPGENCLLTSAMRVSQPCLTSYPSGTDYYGFLRGIWQDGTHQTQAPLNCGGSVPAHFMDEGFPYNWQSPATEKENWYNLGSGPFRMLPGDTIHYLTAMVFTQDSTIQYLSNGLYQPQLFQKHITDIQKIRQWQQTGVFTGCRQMVTTGETAERVEFSLYPNPATEEITIQFQSSAGNFDCVVTDILGRLIKTIKCSSQKIKIDVSDFSSGIYIATINNENSGSSAAKFVVSR